MAIEVAHINESEYNEILQRAVAVWTTRVLWLHEALAPQPI